jgi:hypothetical protein
MVALVKPDNQIAIPQKSNEWYTPARYVEAARAVMGSIDLDPASCAMANQVVKAKRYYTIEDNGLSKPWHGNIWLNPPYGKVNPIPGSTRSYQKLFVEKLLSEVASGHIEQVTMLLLGNCCFTHYFYPLWQYPLCFHDGFISFYKPDGTTDDFGFGTIFVYMGKNEQKFVDTFSQFGTIAKRVSTPKQSEATPISLWEVR